MNLFFVLILLIASVCNGAELLILDKDNWMDNLTQKQIEEYKKKDKNFQRNYDTRSQRNDVIEVQEDGYFKNAEKYTHFRVVRLPGVKKEDLKYLLQSETEETPDGEAHTIQKKRIYSINSGSGKKEEILTNIQSLSIINKLMP